VFSLFKKKKILADCIPEGYVDFHSHILYGIDDGAKTIEDSAFLLQAMIDLRFAKCITTPHTNTSFKTSTHEVIASRYQETIETLFELSKKLDLQVASEYLIEPELVPLTAAKQLLPIKDQYVLVEIPYLNEPLNLFQQLFEIQLAGYQPVLAHPERYPFYFSNLNRYKELKKSGCLFQLNLLSTVGYYGPKIQEIAGYLLKNDMIDFTGSDIHHQNHVKAFYESVKIKEIPQLIEAMQRNVFFR
jgi:tyrosine-protein phosphatase YwqE